MNVYHHNKYVYKKSFRNSVYFGQEVDLKVRWRVPIADHEDSSTQIRKNDINCFVYEISELCKYIHVSKNWKFEL